MVLFKSAKGIKGIMDKIFSHLKGRVVEIRDYHIRLWDTPDLRILTAHQLFGKTEEGYFLSSTEDIDFLSHEKIREFPDPSRTNIADIPWHLLPEPSFDFDKALTMRQVLDTDIHVTELIFTRNTGLKESGDLPQAQVEWHARILQIGSSHYLFYPDTMDLMFIENVIRRLRLEGFAGFKGDWLEHHLSQKNPRFYLPRTPESLLSSGDVSARKTVCEMVINYWKTARCFEDSIVADTDIESLHQYRVHIRKIRSLIFLIPGVFEHSLEKRLRQYFQWFQKNTNALRDVDVEKIFVKKWEAEFNNPHLINWIDNRRRRLFKETRRFFLSKEYHERCKEVLQILRDNSEHSMGLHGNLPISALIDRALDKAYTGIKKKIKKYRKNRTDTAIHVIRIYSKNMRYILELFTLLFPAKSVMKILEITKDAQEQLGMFNDISIQVRRFREYSRESGLKADLFVIGMIIGSLKEQHSLIKEGLEQKFLVFKDKSFVKHYDKLYLKGRV